MNDGRKFNDSTRINSGRERKIRETWVFYTEKGVFQLPDKKIFSTDANLADKTYEPSDYQANTQLGQGLAETHEQVSDAYKEGTVDARLKMTKGRRRT